VGWGVKVRWGEELGGWDWRRVWKKICRLALIPVVFDVHRASVIVRSASNCLSAVNWRRGHGRLAP